MEANTVRLRVADLVLRDDFQVRGKVDAATVRQYAATLKNDPDAMPPIVVTVLNEAPTLVSGRHRVAAMKAVGISETRAEIVEVSSEDEARWLAAEANLKHGLRLRPKALRGVFKAYVEAGRHRRGSSLRAPLKSYREIACELGGTIHYGTVRNWMRKELEAEALVQQMKEGAPWEPVLCKPTEDDF